ncbi:MAG: hypothetical protein KDB80_17955 [Planctomycetes bacterium]|nr:hypothetical protein [Planctomycetota bacterium]
MRRLAPALLLGVVACSGDATEKPAVREPSLSGGRPEPRASRAIEYFAAPGGASHGMRDNGRPPGHRDTEKEGIPPKTAAETNEDSVREVLEEIVFVQRVAMFHHFVDRDGDGVGEALSMRELLGVAKMRNGGGMFTANEPLLRRFEQVIEDGCARHSGYFFQIWLPRDGGGWTTDGMTGTVGADPRWRCYAWPVNREQSGRLVFLVDETGEILSSRNRRAKYEGKEHRPDAGAATGDRNSVHAGDPFLGADGGRWVRDHVYEPPEPPR